MKTLSATAPDTDPLLRRLIVETRTELPDGLPGRERWVEVVAAAGFLAVAIPIAVLFDSGRSLDLPLALALVAAYAFAARVEFFMGSGWAMPTQLVFVPMLFVLPTEAVPLFVAGALLLGRVPEYGSRAVHANRIVLRVAEAWYAVGPAVVLLIAGATTPDWADWPLYAGALAAQLTLDLAVTMTRETIGRELKVRTLLDELRAVYIVDSLLAPVGLLAAFATVESGWAALLVVPLIGLIKIFAQEREARIENALTLSSAYRGTALLLGELLSNSDQYTGSHSRSVVVLAHQVGEMLEVSDVVMREIEFGALLHDVGKLAVPNEIINKPGALTSEEWAVMRAHTLRGEGMLAQIGGVLREVGAVVRSHHERYDGAGYPDGLSGEQIPLSARVITCCDAFNAMTTDRPYRRAMSIAEAIGELRAQAGRQFDPDVVEAVIDIAGQWNGVPRRFGAVSPASAHASALATR
ncbi:MAG: HD-GYP domain-containing protein [Solirubrobacterales bacterium]